MSAMILIREVERRLRVLRNDQTIEQDAVDPVAHLDVLAAGSIWISEAFSAIARWMIMLASLTTGASPAISFSSSIGVSSSGRFVSSETSSSKSLRTPSTSAPARLVRLPDREEDVFLGRDNGHDFFAGDDADLVGREDIERVLHRQPQAVALDAERDHLVAAREIL